VGATTHTWSLSRRFISRSTAELQYLAARLKTPGGIRRLQRELEHACPAEYRATA